MMQFSQKSVKGFFDSSEKTFIIPVYQRAYSWDDKEIRVFYEDLKEQQVGGNTYCYGNILLEKIKKDTEYEVIDGQQRLTTLTIFVRALLNVLKSRMNKEPKIQEKINIIKKEKIYFKDDGNIKLRPVDYDKVCYDTLIIENKNDCILATPSQRRIKEAKDYFAKELSLLSTEEVFNIFSILEEAQVNCIELEGKKDSALMFELQNNRGKELTNLEKLKSLFMYQLYVVSGANETDSNIEYVAEKFDPIYRFINDLKEKDDLIDLDEDRILSYHCDAYTNKGFGYRNLDDLTEEYKKNKGNKVQWIKDFTDELYTSFANIRLLRTIKNDYYKKLIKMGIPYFIYPFLLKGMKYLKDDSVKLNKLFEVMEFLSFRYKLINSRSDIVSKLNPILKSFNGDIDQLSIDIPKMLNDNWYWSDGRIEEYLNGNMYENSMVHYVLWEYEHSIQNSGYNSNNVKIQKEQIEHISPVTPDSEQIESGYEVDKQKEYSEDFIDEKLNCLGNLMIISGSHNASIGNKPFVQKLESYKKNPLLKQQAEIANFASAKRNKPYWDSVAIDKRHEKIIHFAKKRWNF